MHLKERLLEIDAKCASAHRILNKIAIAEVSDPSILGLRDEVTEAIRDLTEARDILHSLAEEPTNN